MSKKDKNKFFEHKPSSTPESLIIKKEEFENSSEKNIFDSDRFWDGETIHDDKF